MKQLLRIELTKTLGYPTFRTLIILYSLLFLLVVGVITNISINVQGINIHRLFLFPFAWGTFAWIAKWFNLLLGILTILIVTNELQFRTFRKQLIEGLTRNNLLQGKLLIIALISGYATLLVFLASILFGALKTPEVTFQHIWEGLPMLPILYIQSFALMLLAMLFAFLLRNPALSIVSYILFFFPVEPILRALIPGEGGIYLPVKALSNLTPMPDFIGITFGETLELLGNAHGELLSIPQHTPNLPLAVTVITAISYSILFTFIIKYIIERRNF